jgi:hypothetical protein
MACNLEVEFHKPEVGQDILVEIGIRHGTDGPRNESRQGGVRFSASVQTLNQTQ